VSEKNFVKKPHGTIDTNFENIYSFDIYKDTKDKDKDNIACRFLIAYKNKLKSFQANVQIDKSKNWLIYVNIKNYLCDKVKEVKYYEI